MSSDTPMAIYFTVYDYFETRIPLRVDSLVSVNDLVMLSDCGVSWEKALCEGSSLPPVQRTGLPSLQPTV